MGRRGKCKIFSPEGHPVVILKKGSHKFYLDTVTQKIIATNPLPLALLAPILMKKLAPKLLAAAPSFLEGFLGREPTAEAAESYAALEPRKGKISQFEKAIALEQAERRR